MLQGGYLGGLEIRRKGGGAELRGSFPYNSTAVLSDGGRTGRPKKERIAPKAFAYRVETPSDHGGKKDIHLLVGHDYGKPLASVRSGSLVLNDTAAALLFTATIAPAMMETTHVRDAMAVIEAGLAGGISPGFRVPPKRAVKEPETVEEEENDPANGKHRALIRTVHEALLYELSIVTRPAYPQTEVEKRNWQPIGEVVKRIVHRPAALRWR